MSEHSELAYFAPLFAWQKQAWAQVTKQFYEGKLPHALLAEGMAGLGKRSFVLRLAAWLLCQEKPQMGACGQCQSCQWLKAQTHPDLRFLPKTQGAAIKVDDIRELTEIIAQKGHVRVIVFDNSETMTLGASNALLKTLEEPNAGVYMLLISDEPSRLLPTIKSRVQSLALNRIDSQMALDYLSLALKDDALFMSPKALLLLAEGAPLGAYQMAKSTWFSYRKLWLQTFVALQTKKRTVLQASDYWQSVLPLAEFIHLSQMMKVVLWRYALGLPNLHEDLVLTALKALALDESLLVRIDGVLAEVSAGLEQNVQEKLGYDRIFLALAQNT